MSSSPVTRLAHFETWRLVSVYLVVFGGLAVLLTRLLGLQVFGGTTWNEQAVENYTTAISVPAARGIIYDRNGYVLARNIASYNIILTPANLPDDDADIQNIYRELSELTEVPVNQGTLEEAKVAACVPGPGIAQMVELQETREPYSPVKVACNVSEETARIVRERAVDWPGVEV